jgi:hypothetical protein
MTQTHPPIQVGTMLVAKKASGVCAAGEHGVCYELYQLGGRPGYGIIFRGGGYDGFSPDDVELFLDVTGRVCPEVARYRFANVTRLAQDFRDGRLANAFPPLKTYTGNRLPGDHGTAAPGLVTVHQEGHAPRPLDPRFDRRQAADSMNWGDDGSGPAQFALALAADVLGDDQAALDVHRRLRSRLVATLPQDGWTLTEEHVRRAIHDNLRERGQGHAR